MNFLKSYNQDNFVEIYDKNRSISWWTYSFVQKYLSKTNNNSDNNNKIIIDLGCGSGSLLSQVDKNFKGLQLIGVDNNLNFLLATNKKLNPNFNGIVNEDLLITPNGNTAALILKELGCEDPNPVPIPFNGDIVISDQVLHHLGGELGAVKLITEASKCSKVGSIFLINWTPPEQIVSFWYLQLVPRLINVFNKMTVPVCRLAYIAKAFGWEVTKVVIHNSEETLEKPENYHNYKLPLNDKFIVTNEIWSLLTDEERDTCHKQLEKMSEEEGKEMFKNLDVHRRAFGQTTTLVLKKIKNVDKVENLVIQNME